MRRFVFALLLPLMLVLTGCGMKQRTDPNGTLLHSAKTIYSSDTSAEDCYLCGDNSESPLSPYWWQNNIALVSLNTFEIKPLEINRYDRTDGPIISFRYPSGSAYPGRRWVLRRRKPCRWTYAIMAFI